MLDWRGKYSCHVLLVYFCKGNIGATCCWCTFARKILVPRAAGVPLQGILVPRAAGELLQGKYWCHVLLVYLCKENTNATCCWCTLARVIQVPRAAGVLLQGKYWCHVLLVYFCKENTGATCCWCTFARKIHVPSAAGELLQGKY